MRLSQRLPDIHSCNNRSTTENKRKHVNDGIELVIYIVLFGHLNVCLYVAKNFFDDVKVGYLNGNFLIIFYPVSYICSCIK